MNAVSGRDLTVAGLIRHLQDLVEMEPAIGEYGVCLESTGDVSCSPPWHGTTYIRREEQVVEIEAAD